MIEDDGPGIPAEVREEIFEPFNRGPASPVHAPGVGIGLSLVRRFSQLQGGNAWVEEREGGGASFRVFLRDARRRADVEIGDVTPFEARRRGGASGAPPW